MRLIIIKLLITYKISKMSFIHYITIVLIIYAIYFLIAILLEAMKNSQPVLISSPKNVYTIQPETPAIINPNPNATSFIESSHKNKIYAPQPVIDEDSSQETTMYDLGLETVNADIFGVDVTESNLLKYRKIH